MEINELIQKEKNNLDQIIKLQNMLIDIGNIPLNEITDFITKEYLRDKESIRQLLYSIKLAIEWRPKQYELYCKIIENESGKIKENFSSDELCIEILTNNFIRLRLYELDLINIESIRKLSLKNRSTKIFFQPELENKPIDDETNRLRHESIHENELFRLIRNDDIEKFKELISISEVDIDMKITYSQYEISSIINDFYRMPNLIEYSAFFGSINIFKYLVLNDAKITPRLPEFAVSGGNYEIIHILEEKECSFAKTMYFALRFHRNEIANYLNENYDIDFNTVMFQTCVLYYNIEQLVDLLSTIKNFDINSTVNKMSIFIFAAENGYLDIVKFLSKIKNIDINASNEIKISIYANLLECIDFCC